MKPSIDHPFAGFVPLPFTVEISTSVKSSVPSIGGRVARAERRVISVMYFVSREDAEACAARNGGADWDPDRVVDVRVSSPEDHANQARDHLVEVVALLVDNAMRDRKHNLAWCDDGGHGGVASIVPEITEAVTDVVGPYFEDSDPRSMGWVGSNGLP